MESIKPPRPKPFTAFLAFVLGKLAFVIEMMGFNPLLSFGGE